MAAVKLASAGDDVKLWDVRAYKCVKQYNPHNENVSAVSWNADGKYHLVKGLYGGPIELFLVPASAPRLA